MKKVFYLLAIFSLSHHNLLAMDPPQKKKENEKSPLIQTTHSDLENRIIALSTEFVDNAATCMSTTQDLELLLVSAIGMRLVDADSWLWAKLTFRKQVKAPYYKNLPVLIEYLVGLKSNPKWDSRFTSLQKTLTKLQESASDTKTLELLKIILEDDSSDKDEAIAAYYDLFERILKKNTEQKENK